MLSGGKKRKVDTECRQFQEEWTDDYFFIMHNSKPICLLCNESISVLKEINIERHNSNKHITQHTLTGQLRKDKIQKLISNLNKQQQMFQKQRIQLDNVVKARFIDRLLLPIAGTSCRDAIMYWHPDLTEEHYCVGAIDKPNENIQIFDLEGELFCKGDDYSKREYLLACEFYEDQEAPVADLLQYYADSDVDISPKLF